jgi:orotidine-5'-phosphate decarboxylase
MPVYSPGIGVQGGEIEQAARSGVNYFIVGRSIIESDKPAEVAEKIQGRIISASQAQG